jgi:hypothetical protein
MIFSWFWESLEKKKKKSYDFLLKSGDDFKNASFKVCQRFMEMEQFPHSFRETILHMLWKKKGPAEILRNNRFIHMKNYWPRLCEALVMGQMKEQILEKSSIFQVGGQPGHSPDEHLFTIKSLIGLKEYCGGGLILTLVDIISFFDRENILDVMETMEELDINKKACRVQALV